MASPLNQTQEKPPTISPQAFAKGSKQLLSRLVSIWSRGEETPRILAFMCIVKLVRNILLEITLFTLAM